MSVSMRTLATFAVELGVKNALPGTEIKFPVGDGQSCLVMQEK